MHKGPQIPLSSTSGKRLARCLGHPCAHKRELVPSTARQHPLPLPRCWGVRERRVASIPPGAKKLNHTHTHTQTCFFFVEAQAPPSSQHRERRALCPRRRAVREGAAGNPHPSVPPGEGQRLCRQAEPRDSPVGERGRPPPALELSGPGCSAGPARPPGAAAAAASGGGAAELRRFLPTREKSLAQAKLFDHKRRGAAAQLSSLAGECGNEVTGAGACRGSGPGLCRRRGGERCARRRSPAGRVCGDFHQPRAGLAACHPHGALRSSRLP